MQELSGLIEEAKLHADPEAPITKDSLIELFHNAFPSQPKPDMIGQEWKDLGFQVCVLCFV